MKRKKRDIPLAGAVWVLRLERNEDGVEGYFSMLGIDGGILVRKRLEGGVQIYATEWDAQKASKRLQREFGINEELITPELVAHETTASFWLDDGELPDGISVEHFETTGKRFLLIRQHGDEFTTDDLDGNAADAIVRVFDRLNRRLRNARGAK